MIGYEEHLIDGHTRTIVAFAGGPQNVFQFGNTLRRIGASHVLFRDMHQGYYQRGVAGIGNMRAVVDYMQRLPNVTSIGISSGAYAALLYGQLAGVKGVIAISPLSGRETDDFDPKWHSRLIEPTQDCVDLRQFFRDGPVPYVRAFISDGLGCEIDRQMAERIHIRDITLIPGHEHKDLARAMRDQGLLDALLRTN